MVPVLFEGNAPIDVGRELRLYNRRHRRALVARDGGCRFPGCDRPPSWTEAHHILEWSRGGKTDLANGILLCRHHHQLVHNNGWQICATQDGFAIIPPRSVDPERTPRPMPAKHFAARRTPADRAPR
jgi:hypothetical protein